MRYVLLLDGPLKPYGGILYRRAFIPSLNDVNSLGLRAGAFYRGGRRSYIGLGIVHESLLDCDRTVYSSCSSTYPEVVVSLKF